MDCDVVVVGGGPAGMATAIRLKQLAAAAGTELSVVVLEKGSEPGAHILSGAVMDPRAINELIPDWKELGVPLNQPVTDDQVLFLGKNGRTPTPDWLVPGCLHNEGNYVISLGALRSGWASMPSRWASRCSRGSQPPKCCTTRRARCAAWPPATWA